MKIVELLKTQEDELLLSAVLKKPREFLIIHGDTEVNSKNLTKFKKLQQELKAGKPLAYLVGYRWFFGSKFKVNPNVLIPRPETELLVEQVLKLIKTKNIKEVIDIGTGSGAIAISIKKNAPTTKIVAVDVSNKALKLANDNAKSILKSKLIFLRSNLLSKIKRLPNNFLICANLPYLSKKQLKEKSIKFEPKLALYGGTNSENLIVKLLKQINTLMANQQSIKGTILLEIDPSQANKIKKAAVKLLPKSKIIIYKDLNNINRLVQIMV